MVDASNVGEGTLGAELDFIRRMTIDLKDILKQQRDLLKEQGFRLPPGTTSTLNDIAKRLELASQDLAMLQRERDQYRALADTGLTD